MPARRKSLSQLALTGQLKKNPARHAGRTPAPVGEGIGYAPRHLTATQRAVWRQIVCSAPPGVLTRADEFVVELAAKLLERIRNDDAKASEISALVNILGRLGMSPVDRERLALSSAAPAKEDDPWAAFDKPKDGPR
jgi:phage terminase small subunit